MTGWNGQGWTAGPGGIAALPATLDPATLYGPGTLSNSDQTLSGIGTATFYAARAFRARSSGIYGFGYGVNGSAFQVGIIPPGDALSTDPYTSAGYSANQYNGHWYHNSSDIGTAYTGTPPTSGNFMIVNFTLLKIWDYSATTGQWNGDVIGNQNPTPGSEQGGITIIAGSYVPFLASNGAYDALTINLVPTGLPVGVSQWS